MTIYALVPTVPGPVLSHADYPEDKSAYPDIAGHLYEAPTDVQDGWMFDGSTFTAFDLAAEQDKAWDAIKAERDRRQHAGVKVGANWFHSDADSRIQQLGLVLLGASIPAGTQWKTLTGSFVTMTQTLAGQIFAATAMSDIAIFTAAEQHKAAMLQLADPRAYGLGAGWPAEFSL